MGLENAVRMECDRCGASKIVVGSSDVRWAIERSGSWREFEMPYGGRSIILCPECAPRFEEIDARHRREIEAYVSLA